MQAKQKITINHTILKAIENESAERPLIILEGLREHRQDIMNLLTSYHWEERGIVEAVEIITHSVDINQNGNGRFEVKYSVNIHYGCSDIDIDLDKQMKIAISVDLNTGEGLLTGEYIHEREPDEL